MIKNWKGFLNVFILTLPLSNPFGIQIPLCPKVRVEIMEAAFPDPGLGSWSFSSQNLLKPLGQGSWFLSKLEGQESACSKECRTYKC